MTVGNFYDAFDKPTPATRPQVTRPVASSDTTPYVNGVLRRFMDAANGTRNDALNAAAYRLGQAVGAGQLDRAETEVWLEDAAMTSGYVADDGITMTRATIRSGLGDGIDDPLAIPEPTALVVPPVTVLRDDLTEAEAEDLTALAYRQAVAREKVLLKVRRDAKRLLDAEEALATFRVPPSRPTLTEELQIPDEPITYTVGEVLPAGGNALLTAQYKSGKTTLINQLAKAWADGEPFLGRFEVNAPAGRIALWNYELDERQYRRWLREVGIKDTDRVTVLNLRGYRMPVTVPHVEDWIVTWLAERDVALWVVDPFARAFVGAGRSENDNTEVGTFLDTLDVIKNRAGVSDLVLPTHTGRAEMEEGEERARGATRLDDWADVRWLLTKDENDVRYFRATGRDVEVCEEKLTYDEGSRGLVFGGGDRTWEKRRRLVDAVVEVVVETPGISLSKLRPAVRSRVEKASNDSIDSAVEYAAGRHEIHVEKGGEGAATRHFPSGVTTL